MMEEEKISHMLDVKDPSSMINLLPEKTKQKILMAFESFPDLFYLDETALKQALRGRNMTPSTTDNALRMKFWIEYERVRANNYTHMVVKNVTTGICSQEFWHTMYLKNALRVAWLCCIPLSYQVRMEETLAYSAAQLREILDLPIHDKDGKLNLALCSLKAKIHMMIDMRLNGAPTQRVEQKSLSINVNRQDGRDIEHLSQGSAEQSLMNRVKLLEQREREATHVPKGPAEWQSMPVTNTKMSEDEK